MEHRHHTTSSLDHLNVDKPTTKMLNSNKQSSVKYFVNRHNMLLMQLMHDIKYFNNSPGEQQYLSKARAGNRCHRHNHQTIFSLACKDAKEQLPEAASYHVSLRHTFDNIVGSSMHIPFPKIHYFRS